MSLTKFVQARGLVPRGKSFTDGYVTAVLDDDNESLTRLLDSAEEWYWGEPGADGFARVRDAALNASSTGSGLSMCWQAQLLARLVHETEYQLGTEPLGATTDPVGTVGAAGAADGYSEPVLAAWADPNAVYVWCESSGLFHYHGVTAAAVGLRGNRTSHCELSRLPGFPLGYDFEVVGVYPADVPHDHRGYAAGCRCAECRSGRRKEMNFKRIAGRRPPV